MQAIIQIRPGACGLPSTSNKQQREIACVDWTSVARAKKKKKNGVETSCVTLESVSVTNIKNGCDKKRVRTIDVYA
jgi:hypothetical protein